jgi:hypothetical protein
LNRYRKQNISSEKLADEALDLTEPLMQLRRLYNLREISDAELVAAYLVLHLAYRHPRRWYNGLRSTLNPQLEARAVSPTIEILGSRWKSTFHEHLYRCGLREALDFFVSGQLRGVPAAAANSLNHWHAKRYPLHLMFTIPTPADLLRLQARGERIVTVPLEESDRGQFILNQRDNVGFVLHDLIHAEHFYGSGELFQGQLGFYRLLHVRLDEFLASFKSFAGEDASWPIFQTEFEYVISDMNSHCVHLLKCFKAVLLRHTLRSWGHGESAFLSTSDKDRFNAWLGDWCDLHDIQGTARAAFLRLNEAENPEDHLLLDDLCRARGDTFCGLENRDAVSL